MKLFKLLTAIALIAGFTACNTEKTHVDVGSTPEVVTKAFKAANPEAENVNWKKEGKYFEAEYELSGKEASRFYDDAGNLVASETEIAIEALPPAISGYVAETHPGATITEADKIEDKNGVSYEVGVKGTDKYMELAFDAEGNYAGQESDDDDDESDDDDNNGGSDD